jgi:hypothetical protein
MPVLNPKGFAITNALTHIPHPEVSHYELWLVGDFGLAIAKRIFPFFV